VLQDSFVDRFSSPNPTSKCGYFSLFWSSGPLNEDKSYSEHWLDNAGLDTPHQGNQENILIHVSFSWYRARSYKVTTPDLWASFQPTERSAPE